MPTGRPCGTRWSWWGLPLWQTGISTASATASASAFCWPSAICQQPGVLLLDEPTSFLDVKGKIELLTILQKLAHEQGLAVIVSLHELDMAQKIADAVVCVFPHSVSGALTPKEAFAPENIRRCTA